MLVLQCCKDYAGVLVLIVQAAMLPTASTRRNKDPMMLMTRAATSRVYGSSVVTVVIIVTIDKHNSRN